MTKMSFEWYFTEIKLATTTLINEKSWTSLIDVVLDHRTYGNKVAILNNNIGAKDIIRLLE